MGMSGEALGCEDENLGGLLALQCPNKSKVSSVSHHTDADSLR